MTFDVHPRSNRQLDVRVDWSCNIEGPTYRELVDQATERLRQFLEVDTVDRVRITIDVDSVLMGRDGPVSYRATARCQI